jgi:hypothetical protein
MKFFQRLNIATTPRLAQLTFSARPLKLTHHAAMRAQEKSIPCPTELTIDRGDVVEVELTNDRISKLVIRQPIGGSDYDMVLVIVPADSSWRALTAWCNHRTDTHVTLNKARLA